MEKKNENTAELAAVKTKLDAVETKLDAVEKKVATVELAREGKDSEEVPEYMKKMTPEQLRDELKQLRKKEEQLRDELKQLLENEMFLLKQQQPGEAGALRCGRAFYQPPREHSRSAPAALCDIPSGDGSLV